MIRPGDIIFFHPSLDLSEGWRKGLIGFFESLANVLGQALKTWRVERWCHVAICVEGPLVIEATLGNLKQSIFSLLLSKIFKTAAPKDGSVRLTILTDKFFELDKITVLRPLKASTDGFPPNLEDSCIYWLGEEYGTTSLLKTLLRQCEIDQSWHAGESFCSFLGQKVLARLAVEPMASDKVALLPGQLFRALSEHPDWTVLNKELLCATKEEHDTIARRNSLGTTRNADLLAPLLLPYLSKKSRIETEAGIAWVKWMDAQAAEVARKAVETTTMLDTVREMMLGLKETSPGAMLLAHSIKPLVNKYEDVRGDRFLGFLPWTPLLGVVTSPAGSLKDYELKQTWLKHKFDSSPIPTDEIGIANFISDALKAAVAFSSQLYANLPPIAESENLFGDNVKLEETASRISMNARILLCGYSITTNDHLKDVLSQIVHDRLFLQACNLGDWQLHRQSLLVLLKNKYDTIRNIQSILKSLNLRLEDVSMESREKIEGSG